MSRAIAKEGTAVTEQELSALEAVAKAATR